MGLGQTNVSNFGIDPESIFSYIMRTFYVVVDLDKKQI